MGSPNEKGVCTTAGVAGWTGVDFFPTGARATALSAVTRGTAFVGGLGEPRALGGSDGGGLLCHGAQ
jgi:hypothetical protein